MQDNLDPFLACSNIAWSAAFAGCCPNGEVAVVVGVVIAGCEVIAEEHECCIRGSVAGTAGPERGATYSAEETHMDLLPVEDSPRRGLDLGIFPSDPVSWNLGVFPSWVSGR